MQKFKTSIYQDDMCEPCDGYGNVHWTPTEGPSVCNHCGGTGRRPSKFLRRHHEPSQHLAAKRMDQEFGPVRVPK